MGIFHSLTFRCLVCFPMLAISYRFDAPYLPFAVVPLLFPSGQVLLGESAQVTELGTVMFTYCFSVKS